MPKRWVAGMGSLVASVVLLTACGSGPTVYDAGNTASAMRDAGWTAKSTPGMQTYTGTRQVAYLETTAPDGAQIDLQFLSSASDASAEYTAAHAHGYGGAVVANVLIVAHTTYQTVTAGDLNDVEGLLRTQ